MIFTKWLRLSRHDSLMALGLLLFFYLYYVMLNLPFERFMTDNKALLDAHNPFYGAPFQLNLFNFDPSMYYAPQASILHPLINYVSVPLKFLATSPLGNMVFLLLQALMNALGAVIIFVYLRKSGAGRRLSLSVAVMYGACSYSIFTALIPDSYPYAVFILLLTVLYGQYCRVEKVLPVLPVSILLCANFGITVTNVITAAIFLIVGSLGMGNMKNWLQQWLKIAVLSLGLVILLTTLQYGLFGGNSWVHNWRQMLQAGGYDYTTSFSLKHHWKVLYSMIEAPVVTPNLSMINEGTMAFVTNLADPFPLYGHILGIMVALLALLGCICGWRSREALMLAVFPLFAVGLHIVKGFGLSAFTYDMYLYAGHYLFALFLLGAGFIHRLRGGWRGAGTWIIMIGAAALVVINLWGHIHALHTVQQVFRTLAAQ